MVNSLGDNFEIKNVLPDYDGESCGGTIYFTDESKEITDKLFCMVIFDFLKYTDYDDNNTWDSLTVLNDFNIDGISEGVSLETVIQKFGEPDEKDNFIYIGYDSDNETVTNISIYL